jgi:hypothetical protein
MLSWPSILSSYIVNMSQTFHRHDRHPPGHRKFWQVSTFPFLVQGNFVNFVMDREGSTGSTAWVVITVLS